MGTTAGQPSCGPPRRLAAGSPGVAPEAGPKARCNAKRAARMEIVGAVLLGLGVVYCIMRSSAEAEKRKPQPTWRLGACTNVGRNGGTFEKKLQVPLTGSILHASSHFQCSELRIGTH